jgi:hypothetical protein
VHVERARLVVRPLLERVGAGAGEVVALTGDVDAGE